MGEHSRRNSVLINFFTKKQKTHTRHHSLPEISFSAQKIDPQRHSSDPGILSRVANQLYQVDMTSAPAQVLHDTSDNDAIYSLPSLLSPPNPAFVPGSYTRKGGILLNAFRPAAVTPPLSPAKTSNLSTPLSSANSSSVSLNIGSAPAFSPKSFHSSFSFPSKPKLSVSLKPNKSKEGPSQISPVLLAAAQSIPGETIIYSPISPGPGKVLSAPITLQAVNLASSPPILSPVSSFSTISSYDNNLKDDRNNATKSSKVRFAELPRPRAMSEASNEMDQWKPSGDDPLVSSGTRGRSMSADNTPDWEVLGAHMTRVMSAPPTTALSATSSPSSSRNPSPARHKGYRRFSKMLLGGGRKKDDDSDTGSTISADDFRPSSPSTSPLAKVPSRSKYPPVAQRSMRARPQSASGAPMPMSLGPYSGPRVGGQRFFGPLQEDKTEFVEWDFRGSKSGKVFSDSSVVQSGVGTRSKSMGDVDDGDDDGSGMAWVKKRRMQKEAEKKAKEEEARLAKKKEEQVGGEKEQATENSKEKIEEEDNGDETIIAPPSLTLTTTNMALQRISLDTPTNAHHSLSVPMKLTLSDATITDLPSLSKQDTQGSASSGSASSQAIVDDSEGEEKNERYDDDDDEDDDEEEDEMGAPSSMMNAMCAAAGKEVWLRHKKNSSGTEEVDVTVGAHPTNSTILERNSLERKS